MTVQVLIGHTQMRAGPPVMGVRHDQPVAPPVMIPSGEVHGFVPRSDGLPATTLCGQAVVHATQRPFPVAAADEVVCESCRTAWRAMQ